MLYLCLDQINENILKNLDFSFGAIKKSKQGPNI